MNRFAMTALVAATLGAVTAPAAVQAQRAGQPALRAELTPEQLERLLRAEPGAEHRPDPGPSPRHTRAALPARHGASPRAMDTGPVPTPPASRSPGVLGGVAASAVIGIFLVAVFYVIVLRLVGMVARKRPAPQQG